jgi:hypothetical protein
MRCSQPALDEAVATLQGGTVAAADGTVVGVPLLGGAKLQIGVVLVFNSGDVVDLVTRVFEYELASDAASAVDFFSRLQQAHSVSNLVSRALMLFGERRQLMDHETDWRLLHGELVPHELRTGAGRPADNLPPTFDLVYEYLSARNFVAVSESPSDLDILNAAILLESTEYIVLRSLAEDLLTFLEGGESQMRANFADDDRRRFREFIERVGPQVSIVLVKVGDRPYLIECHNEQVESSVALFLADSLWTRGLPLTEESRPIRGFPFHLDLADQVARTLFKGGDFRDYVESRVLTLGIEEGLAELDPRRTRG